MAAARAPTSTRSSHRSSSRKPSGAHRLTLTHVANAGFLIGTGESKVLIDALFDEGIRGYGQIPDELRPALVGGQPPFDGVDLALATHFHRDHFGRDAVRRFLAANPRALFVSTRQAVDALGELPADLQGRARAIVPPEGDSRTIEHRGVRVEILNLHHGRDRRPPVENLGFLVTLAGMTVLHVGDTEVVASELAPYRLAERGVDLGLLPSWFVAWPKWIAVTRDAIRPRWIAVMHAATDQAPASWFSNATSYAEMEVKIRDQFPEARIFRRPLETGVYPPPPEPPGR